MTRLLIIAQDISAQQDLRGLFSHNGFTCTTTSSLAEITGYQGVDPPALALVTVDAPSPDAGSETLIRTIKEEMRLPVIVIAPGETLKRSEQLFYNTADDFVVKPYHPEELILRVKRLLHLTVKQPGAECIVCGDLVIDLAKCEVTLCGGVIILTFMEYELLKFLASNKERVFTREALLNKVWGYDYYGGDRTVDVHIRRLRSKIEDGNHTFIETVRNVGYRFKESRQPSQD